MLLRGVRIVPVTAPAPPGAVDVRVEGGRVVEVGPGLGPLTGEDALEAEGRWLIPGLWDAHVHLGQWARRGSRLDVSGTGSVADVCERVRTAPGDGLLIGSGYRPAGWPEQPSVAALDEAAGRRPVVLVSGDAHAGWLSSAALTHFGLTARDEPLREAEWFAFVPRLLAAEDAGAGPQAYAVALREAAAKGVVGVVDYEFEPGFERWPKRYAAAGSGLRVRTSTYPSDLDRALAGGRRTGQSLGDPRLVMGALKIISDGSLNTRTAHCCDPYPDGGHGVQNVPADELADLLSLAAAHGLSVALHAIGDAAVDLAMDAFAATGARGSIEHAQLMRRDQVERMAGLALVASVQPAHLLDDRLVTARIWGEERASRSFPFRELVEAGVRVALGSDAPVAPLDPWLAIAAAVHRGEPSEPAWHAEQSLSPVEALASSTDGAGTVAVGSLADLALLDADPLATGEPSDLAAGLRVMTVWATMVGGDIVHQG
jgi:predicted amidohydrolase YtcJ